MRTVAATDVRTDLDKLFAAETAAAGVPGVAVGLVHGDDKPVVVTHGVSAWPAKATAS